MLDSLYGDLPPPIAKDDSNNGSGASRTAPETTSLLGSLYDDLDDVTGDNSSATAAAAVAPIPASSSWQAQRLQLLTPAVVRKQTLATKSSIAAAQFLATAPNAASGGSSGIDGLRSNSTNNASVGTEVRVESTTNSSSSGTLSAAQGGKLPLDVAAVAAAASAAAAAVAAQLKAVKSGAALLRHRDGAIASDAAASHGHVGVVGVPVAAACSEIETSGTREGVASKTSTAEIDGSEATATGVAVALSGTCENATEGAGGTEAIAAATAAATENDEEKSGFVLIGEVLDEYDPAAPNEYITVYRERIRKQQREELDKLRQQELEKQRREREFNPMGAVAAGAPPLSGVAFGDAAATAAAGAVGAPPAAIAAPAPPALPSYIDPAKKSFAARMMEKMGWKHGEGLGVNKQGITAPLVAKKTAMRSGVIVQGAEVVAAAAQARAQFNRPPTRVLLLLNMVGRGEVDEDLKEETEEEAAKFGNLLQVKIVEAPDVPDEEAVRIFCEYERKEEATLAFLTMNGRVFGGRTVKGKFYCEDRWQKDDFLPNVEEEADKKLE